MVEDSVLSWFFMTVAATFSLGLLVRAAVREHAQRLSEDFVAIRQSRTGIQ